MDAIGWIVLGLIAGYIASTRVNTRGAGLPMQIVLAVAGAVISGWLCNTFGATGTTGFTVWSLLVAVVGAVVLLWGIPHSKAARADATGVRIPVPIAVRPIFTHAVGRTPTANKNETQRAKGLPC